MIREDFLHQNAFHEIDTYSSVEKQYKMISVINYFYIKAKETLQKGVDIVAIEAMNVKDKIARMKYIPQEKIASIDEIKKEIDNELELLFKNI
jgi:V/A-type H+-transporting ATPase subunit A